MVIAIEPSGFHETEIKYSLEPNGKIGYVVVVVALALSLIAGIILASVATLLMWRDKGLYEFGHQTVELASIGERGCARLIDVALILLATLAVAGGLVFLLKLDWRTAAEALSIKVFDHPALIMVQQIAFSSLATLILGWLSLVVMQGRFTLSPGKWICGLRVVRTTLRPCGFSRSLMRELLFFFDDLYLISWAPGILCIAFSECRQRLGDHMADTIVVRRRSLTTPTTTSSSMRQSANESMAESVA
jgi:uncharacterized RDD family membrane protein YckC